VFDMIENGKSHIVFEWHKRRFDVGGVWEEKKKEKEREKQKKGETKKREKIASWF
jgi:hypothetical protein